MTKPIHQLYFTVHFNNRQYYFQFILLEEQYAKIVEDGLYILKQFLIDKSSIFDESIVIQLNLVNAIDTKPTYYLADNQAYNTYMIEVSHDPCPNEELCSMLTYKKVEYSRIDYNWSKPVPIGHFRYPTETGIAYFWVEDNASTSGYVYGEIPDNQNNFDIIDVVDNIV